ncbi:MAG: hypothetical protein PHV34_20585 [Verrucomicrobiae bacterium]|nr:hypothetical protein [Verrucomicrobiae bacterium]
MIIKIHLVPEEGLHLEGDLPPSILDVQEPLYRFEQPVHYNLDATIPNQRSLLIRGRLTTTVRACCVRTLEWFDFLVDVKEFTYHNSEIQSDEVDLTPEIREDILLALPSNPVLPETKPVDVKPAGKTRGKDDIWRKLDQLKIR